MAVQKSKVTRSRRGQRRSHDSLGAPTLSVESTSGETHRRHHVSADGFYRGKQVMPDKKSLRPIDLEGRYLLPRNSAPYGLNL